MVSCYKPRLFEEPDDAQLLMIKVKNSALWTTTSTDYLEVQQELTNCQDVRLWEKYNVLKSFFFFWEKAFSLTLILSSNNIIIMTGAVTNRTYRNFENRILFSKEIDCKKPSDHLIMEKKVNLIALCLWPHLCDHIEMWLIHHLLIGL